MRRILAAMSGPAPDPDQARAAMVANQLRARGVTNERVLAAMGAIPRELFVPEDQRRSAYRDEALPIEAGQTISQPVMVAKMTEHLDVEPGDRILEIGTGSGYQAAVLAWLGAHVTSLERQTTLIEAARARIDALAPALAGTVDIREADGSLGDAAGAPWDGIVVTAAAPSIPDALREQLADGARLVIPVGPRDRQLLIDRDPPWQRVARPIGRLLRLRPAHRRRRLRRVSSGSRGPDFGFVLTWLKRYWLAVWFGVISAMRLQVLITGRPGFDAELYLAATRAWLAGADPWITIESQRFAAPPPTLIPLAPIAILPETVGIALLIALSIAGAVATVRLLRLPWWWILFPPFLDAAWNGNPQNLLVPLILVGAGPIAAFLKIYAVVPIALTLRWRALS